MCQDSYVAITGLRRIHQFVYCNWQAAGSWHAEYQLEALLNSSINPYGLTADVVCIAPYFGGSVAGDLADLGVMNSSTIDEIMDINLVILQINIQ